MHGDDRSLGLVVEDVEAMRAYLRAMLEDDCMEIAEASNLEEARAFLREPATPLPSFILLDLGLPDGNGLDLMSDIDSTIRVIALTADISPETESQCHKAGCDLVIEKSHSLSLLRDIVAGSARNGPVNNIDDRTDNSSCYLSYLAEMRAELGAARRTSDILAIRRIAHQLHGTAVHYGYPEIGSAAKTISTALRAGRLDQCDAAAGTLYTRIGEALEAHARKNSRPANPQAS
jgi:CheY-like chemotaxis protein